MEDEEIEKVEEKHLTKQDKKERIKKYIIKAIKVILKYLLQILVIAIYFRVMYSIMNKLNGSTNMQIFEKDSFKIRTLAKVTFLVWISEYLILKAITGSSRVSLGIVFGLETGFDIVNYIVRDIRGSAITISDIKSIPTALSVAEHVSFTMTKDLAIAIVALIIGILIIIKVKQLFVTKKLHIVSHIILRIVELAVGISLIMYVFKVDVANDDTIWNVNHNYRNWGTPVTIMKLADNMRIKVPEGYKKSEIIKLLANYDSEAIANRENEQEGQTENQESSENPEQVNEENASNEAIAQEDDKPNILIIVNESFTNFYDIYHDGYINSTPFFSSLMEDDNVISGTMYSSEYGGNTANVEFEFLTQNSTKYLPVGSLVFQQYITRNVKTTLVNNLKAQGYKTLAMHPWVNYAYSRNKIYRLLGFDRTKFMDEFEVELVPNFNNEFPTDKSCYKQLLLDLSNKNKEDKILEYVLTVQNHIGFSNPDPNQIKYNDDNENNVYMQLLHESDEAFREVIEFLSNQEEKYIVLFFGDHQPRVPEPESTPTIRYEVPFLIWANYTISGEHNIKTSTIYLQNYLLKAAGLKFSNMNNYIEELKSKYPVITKNFFMDENYNYFENTEENENSNPKFSEYEKVCYYRVFDEK